MVSVNSLELLSALLFHLEYLTIVFLWWHRLRKFFQFLYWDAAPSEPSEKYIIFFLGCNQDELSKILGIAFEKDKQLQYHDVDSIMM